MNESDLTLFFQEYGPEGYEVGVDDTVSKYVGDKGTGNPGTEASLRISDCRVSS